MCMINELMQKGRHIHYSRQLSFNLRLNAYGCPKKRDGAEESRLGKKDTSPPLQSVAINRVYCSLREDDRSI